jgi:hypothetical protein
MSEAVSEAVSEAMGRTVPVRFSPHEAALVDA